MTVARTLRAMGTGLSDLGGALTWGEAILLLEAAAGDPSTHLGAELAGWSYPASVPTLLALTAQVGGPGARKVMPWVLRLHDDGPRATPDEVAVATAELEDSIVFT